MTAQIKISKNLLIFLTANLSLWKNYLVVRAILALVMRKHLAQIPVQKHYNRCFTALSDQNWKALVDNCCVDLLSSRRCNLDEDFPELLRLYLIHYARGDYQRIKYLMNKGMIKVQPPSPTGHGKQHLHIYQKEVDRCISRFKQGECKPTELAYMMFSVIIILEMNGHPRPHYDRFFSKLAQKDLLNLTVWLFKQKRQLMEGTLSSIREQIVKGTLIYLYFYANRPDSFRLMQMFDLV